MGNYGVSDPSISHHGSPYYMSQSPFAHHSTMMVRPSHHPLGLDRSVVLAAPHLHNGHREVMSRRTRLQSPDAIYIKPESALDGSEARSLSVSPSATPGNTSSNRLKKRPAKKSNKKANAREEHLNCYGEEVAPTLKDHCPDEERLIFESRWHFREKRGHDMWNHIQSDFAQKFKRSHGKEMLQMKFRRARSRYILWLRKDVSKPLHYLDRTSYRCLRSALRRKRFFVEPGRKSSATGTKVFLNAFGKWVARVICALMRAISRSR